MKNRFITVYSVFISLVFLFSVGLFAGNLYKEYNLGFQRTQKRFDSLTYQIRKNAELYEPGTIQYSNALISSIGNIEDFQVLKIYLNKKSIYLYPDLNSDFTDSNMTSNKTSSFAAGPNDDAYHIEASLYKLRPTTVLHYARISFLIILISTLITVLILIYINLTENNTSSSSINYDDESLDSTENNQETISEESISTTDEKIEINQDSENENVNIVHNNSDENIEVSSEEDTSNEEPAPELPIAEKPIEMNSIYSESTGLTKSSYLMNRLDSELERATSSETDLALFIFKINNYKDSEEFKNVCNYLSIQFQFVDLLFEYESDCIAAIKINMNLDEAILFADKLHSDIIKLFNDGETDHCQIGISTRTIRIISGERLLHEANEALKHAETDKENPIIAFRADIEKYKQFLENN